MADVDLDPNYYMCWSLMLGEMLSMIVLNLYNNIGKLHFVT